MKVFDAFQKIKPYRVKDINAHIETLSQPLSSTKKSSKSQEQQLSTCMAQEIAVMIMAAAQYTVFPTSPHTQPSTVKPIVRIIPLVNQPKSSLKNSKKPLL